MQSTLPHVGLLLSNKLSCDIILCRKRFEGGITTQFSSPRSYASMNIPSSLPASFLGPHFGQLDNPPQSLQSSICTTQINVTECFSHTPGSHSACVLPRYEAKAVSLFPSLQDLPNEAPGVPVLQYTRQDGCFRTTHTAAPHCEHISLIPIPIPPCICLIPIPSALVWPQCNMRSLS